MAKLSELVRFQQDLTSMISQLLTSPVIEEKIVQINNLKIRNNQSCHLSSIEDLLQYYTYLRTLDHEIVNKVNAIIQQIRSEIDQEVQGLYNNINGALISYNEIFSCDGELVNGRGMNDLFLIDTDAKDLFNSRIMRYSNWLYPGLLIGTRSYDYIDSLVACEPLYLVNYDLLVVDKVVSTYPNSYQQRLRTYPIKGCDYSQLPQGQFGLVVCWDYYNYINQFEIEKSINNIFDLLRPGGTLLFSYNDADTVIGAILAETNTMSYCNHRIITRIAEQRGYQIQSLDYIPLKNGQPNAAWQGQSAVVELLKPGELSTSKLRPVVGSIKTK